MLKIRLMGTKNDITWFKKIILQIVCRSKKEQCKRIIVEFGGISSCVKL